MGGWKWGVAALAGVACLGAAACGGDSDDDGENSGDGDTAAVEQAINDVFAAWNAEDADAFTALFTDEGILDLFGEEGQTADEVRADLANFVGADPIETQEFNGTAVDGENATSDVQYTVGASVQRSEFALITVDGAWLINGEDVLQPEAAEGTDVIDVQMNEFAFGAAIDTLDDGDIAFNAENVGEQEHEIAVVRIESDISMDDLLDQFMASEEGEVEGVEFMGQTSAMPGETSMLVFAEPLASGRYALVCFFPDTAEGEDGTPHAMHGMTKEFTVS
jgi:hypothetical protein